MRTVTTLEEFKVIADEILEKKDRYNSTLDNALFNELNKLSIAPFTVQGIKVVEDKQITISNISCTVYTLYNPYMVYAYGASVCVCLSDTVNQVVLYVDDDYFKLSDNVKRFTLYHELGHIEYHHVFNNATSRKIKLEKEADSYALTYMNKKQAKNALSEVRDLLKDVPDAVRELTKRMEEM